MDLKERHLLSLAEFNKEGLLQFFEEVRRMEDILKDEGQSQLLSGKILATIFYEPSTRTRFSFETAMQRLGGRVISNADMMTTSSVKKRETLKDTAKVVSQMADVIAFRHPESGSAAIFADGSDVPVINAGDGANEHPTQALLDLYTIWKEKSVIDGLNVGIVGDLKYGRVPHSQCELLKHFDCSFVFISPDDLNMPEEIVNELKGLGLKVVEGDNLQENIDSMDVISMTRVQEERFDSESEYKKYAGRYVLNASLMEKAKGDSVVIHPLPRVDEISEEVDRDVRAKYFDQVGNGVAVRMALLKLIMGK